MINDPVFSVPVEIQPPLSENFSEWPIFKLHANRDKFVSELVEFTKRRFQKKYKDCTSLINKAIFLEKKRVKNEPWKVDLPNEPAIWKKLEKAFRNTVNHDPEPAKSEKLDHILEAIIRGYAEEIVGTFNPKTFKFVRGFLTYFFNQLLNKTALLRLGDNDQNRARLYKKLKIYGDVELIRALHKKGTLVVLPTHVSNLDSIVIGYVLDAFLGLPSFSYGAGLNLYNSGVVAYFMNRMGTYRVDRRKKNEIYLETLKAMSNLALQKGTNSLFFPGGTRSRSGAVETKLKLGLLSTLLEAQRSWYERNEKKKIYLVPLTVSYTTVLEARQLVDQHLSKTTNEEFLLLKDQSPSILNFFNGIRRLFKQNDQISFSFGMPMDVFGYSVDEEGRSFDSNNREVDISAYYVHDGKITADIQRESVYTQQLAKKVVAQFQASNLIEPSHLVSYAFFSLLKANYSHLNLADLLNLPVEDIEISSTVLEKCISDILLRLKVMAKNNSIRLSKSLDVPSMEIIKKGLRSIGIYHTQRPLYYKNNKAMVASQNLKVLFYYHNRLSTAGLERQIDFNSYFK